MSEEEKIHKKPHERYQNLTKKEKTKYREHSRKRYKDLRDFKIMAG